MARGFLLLLGLLSATDVAIALVAPATHVANRAVSVRMGKTVGSSSRPFSKTGPRKPQSPRPEQYPDEAKLAKVLTTQRNEKYDPEYAEDITAAKRRLFDLRMRKSQRLPFKSSEFRELRKFVARLKTQQRADELRAQGVDLKKKQPRTRRERLRAKEKRERKDKNRAENRARLMARSEEQEALKRAAAATVEA